MQKSFDPDADTKPVLPTYTSGMEFNQYFYLYESFLFFILHKYLYIYLSKECVNFYHLYFLLFWALSTLYTSFPIT